ncbi:sigma-70 family RNA polymerase sigma factor [Paenibacillus pasadenensis]|uniref:RNA polymerase sigma factor n=1 Tax=Paenibacillus pasadenensis TaxID=217090 RepID=UPI00203B8BCA|nr:sigma-70 family RNA polymerase sigma factor [Paenibacillus pasadenensis]MCM3749569.1 sigma-70 family RNA polymerase sigma factor [Paenibacillus pasadenensis]
MLDRFDYLRNLAEGYERGPVLEDMMSRFGTDVWNFAYFLTRRSEAADDVAQEVFLAAYRNLYSFRGGENSLKSWLLKITRNKSLNYLQSAFVRKVLLLGDRLPSEKALAAEDRHFETLEREMLWQAVLELPVKYREIIILEYHYDLKLKEITQLTGISEGTVKSRSHRAKKKLAASLGENH